MTISGPSVATGRRQAVGRFIRDNRSVTRVMISFLVVGLVWEISAQLFLSNTLFIVPLSRIFTRFGQVLADGSLAVHSWTSAQEFIGGFGLAIIVGIPLGVLIATNAIARDYIDPWISTLYATPVIALAPLFIIVFGIGIASKIAVVFLLAIFPIIVNTAAGIRSADRHLIEAARSFGASSNQIFTKVLIPGSLSTIVAGLRLGVGRGVTAVVVGELFGAQSGLGYFIIISSHSFDTAGLFVGVITLAVTGFSLVALLQRLETRLAPWRQSEVG